MRGTGTAKARPYRSDDRASHGREKEERAKRAEDEALKRLRARKGKHRGRRQIKDSRRRFDSVVRV